MECHKTFTFTPNVSYINYNFSLNECKQRPQSGAKTLLDIRICFEWKKIKNKS